MKINFHYETDFTLDNEFIYSQWATAIIASEGRKTGAISYIFCDDAYLLDLNINYLNHNTLTDIISFDYAEGDILNGELYISVDRLRENATEYGVSFHEELLRVMAHGILHYCGYNDKTDEEITVMRSKEEEKIKMFHVKQL